MSLPGAAQGPPSPPSATSETDGPASAPSATAGVDAPRDAGVLRVASYNLRDFLDDRRAAARVVRAMAPDVLCLQEVPRRLTTEVRLPGFARAAGLRWVGGRLGTGGTVILVGQRVSVRASTRLRLPVRFPDRTRGMAGVVVELDGHQPLPVVSVHLSLRQAQRVLHAADILAVAGTSAVICGDLNEGADGAAWAVLAAGRRLVSALAPTFPASDPSVLLDVVLAPDRVMLAAPSVPVSALPGVSATDLAAASDHLPVYADLVLARS